VIEQANWVTKILAALAVFSLSQALVAQGNDGDGGGEAPAASKCKAGKQILADGEICDDWAGGPGSAPLGCTFVYDIAILPNGNCPDPCKFHMQVSATGGADHPLNILQWSSSSSGGGKDDVGPVFVIDKQLTVECSATSGHYDCIHISASWQPQHSAQVNFRLTCSKCTTS